MSSAGYVGMGQSKLFHFDLVNFRCTKTCALYYLARDMQYMPLTMH